MVLFANPLFLLMDAPDTPILLGPPNLDKHEIDFVRSEKEERGDESLLDSKAVALLSYL